MLTAKSIPYPDTEVEIEVPLKKTKQAAPPRRGNQGDPEKARLTLEMNPDMNEALEELVRVSNFASKADVLRKAILLLLEVRKANARGEDLAFIKDNQILTRILGIGF